MTAIPTKTTSEPVPGYDLRGKTAIVTGAGSGICLSFTTLLLEAGTNVVLADLALRPEAQQVVDQYKTGSPRALFVKTNVTKWAELDALFVQTEQAFGSFDILCPGAGVFEPTFSSFWHPPGSAESRDLPDSDRYVLLDLNLTHPIRATQMALARWLAASPRASPSNPKRVVHIASVAGLAAGPATPLYHASKFGVVGFVRSLGALEDVCGVRVNGVAPGLVMTPLWREQEDKMRNVRDGDETWILPVDVARGMMELVTGEWAGGEIMEISRRGVYRRVARKGDEGTPSEDFKGYKVEDMVRETLGEMGKKGWGMEGLKQ